MVVPISNIAIDDDGIRCPENVIVDHFVIVKIPFNNPIDTVAPADTIALRIGAGHEIAKVTRTGMHVVDIRFRQTPRRSSRAGLRHHILLRGFIVRLPVLASARNRFLGGRFALLASIGVIRQQMVTKQITFRFKVWLPWPPILMLMQEPCLTYSPPK